MNRVLSTKSFSLISLAAVFLVSVLSLKFVVNDGYSSDEGEDPAVTRFREYLRIDSSHPDPDYESCIKWFRQQADEIGLEFNIVRFPKPNLFAVWLTWRGSNPNLKSIMLNSHIDVVPADPTKWIHPPFAAIKDEHGNIYGRGAQDRKSLGTQHLESIRRLKSTGFVPLRDVHVTFVPDEELGGKRGMKIFVGSDEFKNLNIGFEMDEGGASPENELYIYYGERNIFQFKVIATGKSSHSSLMFEDNAAVKLEKVISRLLAFRKNQTDMLKRNPKLEAGDLTSINLSQLGGGLQPNVMPSELWAIFDMRIKLEPNWQFSDVEKMLDDICAEAGPGVRYEYIMKTIESGQTTLDENNVWWTTIRSTVQEMGWKLSTHFFAGATDARYLRDAGYPALGFSPLPNSTQLGHQNNEFISEQVFLQGIDVYEKLLPRITNVPANVHD